jgi:hypothetical protein
VVVACEKNTGLKGEDCGYDDRSCFHFIVVFDVDAAKIYRVGEVVDMESIDLG